MGFLNKMLSALFSKTATPGPSNNNMVVYGGPEGRESEGRYEFGIYVPGGNGKASWFPAAAVDEAVISQLKAMKIGQSFRIVSEDNDEPAGVLVKAIEVTDDMPLYSIPQNPPDVLSLKMI